MSQDTHQELEVLYEDAFLIAVNKPAWWVVHPTRGAKGAPTVLQALQQQLEQRVFPVHRLDRQASGVLVLARTQEVASSLGADIREGRWRKSYQGLCRGVILDSVRVERPVPEGEARRPALTHVDPLRSYCNRYTLLEITPVTGRRHQIRYHLKNLSHPLVGDASYGQGKINRFFRETFGLERMFLHAWKLWLPHPAELRALELNCPLPGQLSAVLEQLESYTGPVP
jgi:tRNA pseudouridine65 synthase